MNESDSAVPDGSFHTRETLRLQFQVVRCQAGDEAAFRALYEAFAPNTLRYLRSLLDGANADDVQQEVWLSVYRRISGLANPAGFRTWLFQIARHRAIDWLRARRSNLDPVDDVDEPADEGHPAADEMLELRDMTERLERALERLSTAHREVLVLRYREELSYAEIALVTGAGIGTVRSRIHHAKLHMRTILDGLPA